MCHALHHLHSDSRIHKDLKLENVMLLSPTGPPHLVLIDLGMMEIMPEEEEGGKGPIPAGTPVTMAPEVIDTYLGRRPGGFDQRCDIYSLGVVAFEMLTGRQPYEEPLVGGKGSETDYEGSAAPAVTGRKAARLSGCQAARLPGCQAARLPGCQAVRPPGCQAARLPGCQASVHTTHTEDEVILRWRRVELVAGQAGSGGTSGCSRGDWCCRIGWMGILDSLLQI